MRCSENRPSNRSVSKSGTSYIFDACIVHFPLYTLRFLQESMEKSQCPIVLPLFCWFLPDEIPWRTSSPQLAWQLRHRLLSPDMDFTIKKLAVFRISHGYRPVEGWDERTIEATDGCSQKKKGQKKPQNLGFYQQEIGIKANNECWLNRKMRDGFWLTNAFSRKPSQNAWTSRSRTEELEPAAEVFFDQSFLRLVYWRCLKIGNPKVWWLSLSKFPIQWPLGHWYVIFNGIQRDI